MPDIIRITSEALQASVRRLLPSQQGFGDDLQATNLITPIIDLTPTAEGSALPIELSTALAFGSQTAFSVSNATSTLVNTTGFYRVFGTLTYRSENAGPDVGKFSLTDGLSTKDVWQATAQQDAAVQTYMVTNYDFIVFLAAGESLSANTSSVTAILQGSTRQVADVNGNIVNPSGFVVQ